MQNFWVVTNAKYVDIVKQQLPNIPAKHILAEPAARNTAPCIAGACWSIKKEDPLANVVVTPADALVMNLEESRRVIKNAIVFTDKKNAIVTIGIKPSRPETGYGYVEAEEAVEGEICGVKAFKEKPDLEIAEQYLKAGNYLWNAGIFVWNVETIANRTTKYKPSIAVDMDMIVATGDLESVFPKCEMISIDFAVMEPASADNLDFTHPADFGWSDLGNWASLHDKLSKDVFNNGTVGNVKLCECRNCVVHAEDAKKVVLQGLDRYIFSEKNGQILLCKRSEEQRIRVLSAN